MNKFSSNRARHIQPFYVMDLLARAGQLEAEGRSVVHLEVGEPDFPTAQPIIDAGIEALKQQHTHYTAALGLPVLRQKIAAYYLREYAVDLDPARIVVTAGASGALQLVLAALLDVDDEVLLADPGYPCNRNIAEILAAKARAIPVDNHSNFQLTAEQVVQHWRPHTRVAMVASPSNPTGTLISPQALQALHQSVCTRQGTLIVDEIYQGLVYDSRAQTALQLDDSEHNLIVINSFSKYFGMTGWRIGWAVLPERLVPAVDRLAQNLFLAPPTVAQYAALRALDEDCKTIFDQRVEVFRQRRDYLLPALRETGFIIDTEPQGAFYIYADCSVFSRDSFRWCHGLLEAEAVAVTPGIDFGEHRAGEFVRFAYTRPVEQLEMAVERIINYINKNT